MNKKWVLFSLSTIYSGFLLFVLSLYCFFAMSCDSADKMNDALKPVSFDSNDIRDLEEINNLILKNVDLLMESSRNHAQYNHEENSPDRYEYFYFTKPWLLIKYLPSQEKVNLDFLHRHSFEYKESRRNFEISNINFRPSDSSVSYEIKMVVIGDNVIEHELWHNMPQSNLKVFGNGSKKNIIKFNDKWTYVIHVYIDDEWS